MRIEPGTLGMDIKAPPTPASTHHVSDIRQRPYTDSLANDIVYRREFALQLGTRRHPEEVSGDEIRREGGTVRFSIWLNTPPKKFCDPSTVIHQRRHARRDP